MPFHLPFNFPFFYNNYRYPPRYDYKYRQPQLAKPNIANNNTGYSVSSSQDFSPKNSESYNCDSENSDSSEYFFEILGLKLYLDDILIICILFFLYTEGVQDEELFLCLILLLLT